MRTVTKVSVAALLLAPRAGTAQSEGSTSKTFLTKRDGAIAGAFVVATVGLSAFDPRIAPSGFLGESGAPRTFGVNAGVTF